MINPTSDDPARSETVVLESVSRLERTVFHGILVRHIRNTAPGSIVLRPNMGPQAPPN